MYFKICVLILLLFLPCMGYAQNEYAVAESLFTVGKNLLTQGDKKGAASAFKKALANNKTFLLAHSELGKMAVAEENWSKAAEEFDAVLKLDPDNLEGHYYRGICHRETGKFRLLLARILDWPKAEKHFKSVMNRDSLYKDILYQFALLKRYRGKYTEAIRLCHDQIRLRPDLMQPKLELYRFYQYFIKHKNQKEVFNWLNRQRWDQAHYFIGERLRRGGKLIGADSVFQELLGRKLTMSKQPFYLSLVKIYYKQKKNDLAEKYFWQAVNNIQTDLDAGLIFADIKYILTDVELQKFRALKDAVLKIKFFHQFWARRDPTPAAKNNVRLAEHYRRLNYTEKNYEYDGFRTWFNSSDPLNYLQFPESYFLNHEFDDRGLVYLRYGPADDQIVTVGGGRGPAPSNESWKYWQRAEDSELTFHFLKPADVWRLSPTLPADPEIYADRYHWGSIYYRYMHALSSGERYAIGEEMALESRKSVEEGFARDRHSWDKKIKPLDVPFYTASFRGREGKTILEVYYGLPMQEMVKSVADTLHYLQLESGLAVHDLDWNPNDKQLRTTKISFKREKVKKSDLFRDLFQVAVLPDSYQVAFHIRPVGMNLLGGHNGLTVKAPDYSTSALSLSDIVLASSITPAANHENKFVKNGLRILPNPTRRFPLKQTLYIYFEIYNLELDAKGQSGFTIEYSMGQYRKKRGIKQLFGLFGGGRKSSISVRSERQGKSSFSAENIAVDVSKLKKGEYTFTVKVTDKISKASMSKQNQLTLYLL